MMVTTAMAMTANDGGDAGNNGDGNNSDDGNDSDGNNQWLQRWQR